MRQRNFFRISAAVLLTLLQTQATRAAGCTSRQASEAESKVDELKTIEQARLYFHVYRRCLDGPIAYGFINTLAELAVKPNGITDLWKAAKPDPMFRDAVLRMLPSEAIPLDVSVQLLEALKAHCPLDARSFCVALGVRVRKACRACPP